MTLPVRAGSPQNLELPATARDMQQHRLGLFHRPVVNEKNFPPFGEIAAPI